MADINIERKSGGALPWIIAVVVLLVLAIGAYFLLADSDRHTVIPNDRDTVEEVMPQREGLQDQQPPPPPQDPSPDTQ